MQRQCKAIIHLIAAWGWMGRSDRSSLDEADGDLGRRRQPNRCRRLTATCGDLRMIRAECMLILSRIAKTEWWCGGMSTTKPKKKNARDIEIWPWTHIREAMGRESRPVWWEGLKGSAPIISDAALAPYSGLWPCQIEASKGPRYGKPSDTQSRDNLVVLVGCKAPGHQGLGAGISFQGRPPMASGHFWASKSQLKPTGVKTNAAWYQSVTTTLCHRRR